MGNEQNPTKLLKRLPETEGDVKVRSLRFTLAFAVLLLLGVFAVSEVTSAHPLASLTLT